ncbi:hypothetical protein J6590_009130 [Homalodisca vitripennis]|nr:hypothetical protein J6590_009130 [Homalodisca vitripennis]
MCKNTETHTRQKSQSELRVVLELVTDDRRQNDGVRSMCRNTETHTRQKSQSELRVVLELVTDDRYEIASYSIVVC